MKIAPKNERRYKIARALLNDRRGTFAILFAIVGAVLAALIGLGIDYFVALSDKARLDAAADSAAIAGANAAKTYYGANASSYSESVLLANAEAAGVAAAQGAFAANMGSTQVIGTLVPTITITYPQALTFSASVSWRGSVAAHFGTLLGFSAIGLSGTSSATSVMQQFLDFYVVTDVSGSMGIPTSTSDQQKLILTNPDNKLESNYPGGCQFACHFPGYTGFAYTQQSSVNIQLKLNSVGNAIQALIAAAAATETANSMPTEFRIGIYPFIVNAMQAAPLSNNLASSGTVQTVANNLANYLDFCDSSGPMGSGGTHFENLWKTVSPYLNAPGSGASATSAIPVIILVTDGVDNPQTYPFTGSWPQLPDTTSSSSFCTLAKKAGYTVAVLFIPYVPIADPAYIWNDEDVAVNYLIDPTTYVAPPAPYKPNVPTGSNNAINMQSCASTGYFFQAGTASEISTAMQTIFYQANSHTRLTQ